MPADDSNNPAVVTLIIKEDVEDFASLLECSDMALQKKSSARAIPAARDARSRRNKGTLLIVSFATSTWLESTGHHHVGITGTRNSNNFASTQRGVKYAYVRNAN